MSRITLQDNTIGVVTKMGEGNPGAMNALMEILQNGKTIEPSNPMEGLGVILILDSLGIYGSDIYILHSDLCDRNVAKTIAVIRSYQIGFLDGNTLKNACKRQDYSGKEMISVDDLYQKVKNKVPDFDL